MLVRSAGERILKLSANVRSLFARRCAAGCTAWRSAPSRPRTTSYALQLQMQRRRLLYLELQDLITYVSWYASLLVACPSTSHSLAPARTQLNANNERGAEHAPPGGLAQLLGMSLDPPARRSARSPYSTGCHRARIAWLSAHNRLLACIGRAPAQPAPTTFVFVNTARRPLP